MLHLLLFLLHMVHLLVVHRRVVFLLHGFVLQSHFHFFLLFLIAKLILVLLMIFLAIKILLLVVLVAFLILRHLLTFHLLLL